MKTVRSFCSFVLLANVLAAAAFYVATDRLPAKLEVQAEAEAGTVLSTNMGRPLCFPTFGCQQAKLHVPVGWQGPIILTGNAGCKVAFSKISVRERKVFRRTWPADVVERTADGLTVRLDPKASRLAPTRACVVLFAVLQVLLFAAGALLLRLARRRKTQPLARADVLYAAAFALPAALTIGFVVPMRIYLGNAEALDLSFAAFLGDMSAWVLTVWALGFLSCVCLGRLGVRWVAAVVVGVAVYAYVETGLMTADLPVLNGELGVFDNFRRSVVDALVAAAEFGVVVAAYLFCERRYGNGRACLLTLALAVTVMSFASLLDVRKSREGVMPSDTPLPIVSKQAVLDSLVHSPDKNVAVYVLDSIATPHAVEVLRQDAGIREALGGFVCFTNNVGMHYPTLPSVAGMLTGKYYEDPSGYQDYCRSAFGRETVLADYLDRGADVFYSPGSFGGGMSTRAAGASGSASASRGGYARMEGMLPWNVYEIVRLQLVPFALKLRVYFDTMSGWNRADSPDLERNCYAKVAAAPVDGRCALGFQFWHTEGSHAPHDVDRHGVAYETARLDYASKVEKTWYVLSVLADHLRALRRRGLYDNTMIVVAADHGTYPDDGPELVFDTLFAAEDFQRRERLSIRALPILWVKPMRATGALEMSAVPTSHSRICGLLADAATNCTTAAEAKRILRCDGERLFRQDDGVSLLDCVVDSGMGVRYLTRADARAQNAETVKPGCVYALSGSDARKSPVTLKNCRLHADNVTMLGYDGLGMTFKVPEPNAGYRLRLRVKTTRLRNGKARDGHEVEFRDGQSGETAGLSYGVMAQDVVLPVRSDGEGVVSVSASCRDMRLELVEFEVSP